MSEQPSEAAMRAAVDLEIQMACNTITTRGLALHLDKIAATLGVAQAPPEIWLLAGRIAGAELNLRNNYQQLGE